MDITLELFIAFVTLTIFKTWSSLYSYILQFLIISVLYVASVFNSLHLLSFFTCLLYKSSFGWYYYYTFCCLLSQTFPPHYLTPFNQQLSQLLRAQVSNCSTFHIMWDVPSTGGICTESIECFRVLYLYFCRFLLFLSLTKQLLFQHVN